MYKRFLTNTERIKQIRKPKLHMPKISIRMINVWFSFFQCPTYLQILTTKSSFNALQPYQLMFNTDVFVHKVQDQNITNFHFLIDLKYIIMGKLAKHIIT